MSNFNISTHTSLAERDAVPSGSARISSGFLLTHPLWDVTWSWLSAYPEIYPFLLTRSLRDVTTADAVRRFEIDISTHMPLAGRDWSGAGGSTSVSAFLLAATCGTWRYTCGSIWMFWDFYSHAPCGTWHVCWYAWLTIVRAFLLTRPLRDVTVEINRRVALMEFLLTRPLRDVTKQLKRKVTVGDISTHTPLAGRDRCVYSYSATDCYFYSHAPCGTWHRSLLRPTTHPVISTHTPLAGRDPVTGLIWTPHLKFLLTRPLRDVTLTGIPFRSYDKYFYSHAPCGTWRYCLLCLCWYFGFLLTRPLRDVTFTFCNVEARKRFLLTRPLRDVTAFTALSVHWNQISTHTPLAGRDGGFTVFFYAKIYFYSHAPCGTWPCAPRLLEIMMIFLLTRPLRDVTLL